LRDISRGILTREVHFSDKTSVTTSTDTALETRIVSWSTAPKLRTVDEMACSGRRFSIANAGALELPSTELPLDAYVLGYWLGDGDSRAPTLSVGDVDYDEVTDLIEGRGYVTKEWSSRPGVHRLAFQVPGAKRGNSLPNVSGQKGVLAFLRELNLVVNKHVPGIYKRASAKQRLDLLRGLMDSDGHVTKDGVCCFSNSNERLVQDTLEIVRSLGESASVTWHPDPRSRTGGGYKVNFIPRRTIPFLLKRKRARVTNTKADTQTRTRIIKIGPPMDGIPVRVVILESAHQILIVGAGFKAI
jgi:hypothetical protein